MNFLDLFSGIGGFSLGAKWAGLEFENHYFSEIDPYAIKVYEKNFSEAINAGDIKGVRKENLPEGEWVVTGGFPCQDISIAGAGRGLEGSRSGLWYEMQRIIGDLRPRIVIAENVGALTFRGLDAVLASLAEIGYDAEWQDVRASDMGAPHRRERIWIVAYPESTGTGRNKLRLRGQLERTNPQDSGYSLQEISSEDSRCEYGQQRTEVKRGIRRQQKERDSCSKFERPGTARVWDESVESFLARMDDGIPGKLDSHRLRCLGNSIVPQIAEVIFRQIIKAGMI